MMPQHEPNLWPIKGDFIHSFINYLLALSVGQVLRIQDEETDKAPSPTQLCGSGGWEGVAEGGGKSDDPSVTSATSGKVLGTAEPLNPIRRASRRR